MTAAPPRLVISAVGGDGGKTLLSLGLIADLRERGLTVAPFKKGPDYIDAAWLSLAAGRDARNLDTYLMGPEQTLRGFAQPLKGAQVAVIEGNRGLHDGMDAIGAHSTASLARLLAAPVVLVLDATKVTRTLAAVALGCQQLEPDVPLAAVVLNNVATSRHEIVARQSIETATGLPVVGAIRRRRGGGPLPDRHLGLVTPDEHRNAADAIVRAHRMVRDGVDVESLLSLARGAQHLELDTVLSKTPIRSKVVIGVLRDAAFSFYYPENLESLEEAGATLRMISSLESSPIPRDIHGLYIGGGFPETHASQLADNEPLLTSLKAAAERGLPIYAECGGLMLLSRSITWNEETFPMAGVFDVDVEVCRRPQGHGYCEVRVDRPNPFFEMGVTIKGHEFHYSTIKSPKNAETAYAVERGTGCFDKRDGLNYKNVLASYAHLHALGVPEWSQGFVRQASRYRRT